MPKVRFHFEEIDGSTHDLTVKTGADEISWAYNLNTANFPTYGGEVIQILSVYIDDLLIKGQIKNYEELEHVYSYFAKYMIVAGQGNDGKGSYNQKPMTMYYEPRQWVFKIQPIKAPGFLYSLETISPTWEMRAHVVDETAGNYETLKEMVVSQAISGDHIALKGIISPASGDPTQNPFSAPNVKADTKGNLKHLADQYNELIKTYLGGDYKDITSITGAKPAFGTQAFGNEAEQLSGQETINKKIEEKEKK